MPDALRMLDEVIRVAALDAKKFTVDAAVVPVVAAQDFVLADAQGGLAAVAAVRADRAEVGDLPRARLVAVGAAGERPHRTNVNAHAALFTFEVVAVVRGNLGMRAPAHDTERAHPHAFRADPHAAVTEDAARRVEVNDRRPLLLLDVALLLDETAFGGPVTKHHVLQLALASLVADRAIERMVAEQKLEHRPPRLRDLCRRGADDHALPHRDGAGGLELRRFLNLDQAHAARGL